MIFKYNLALTPRTCQCNVELHTKEEYEKPSKTYTLTSIAWFVVIATILLGTVVVLGNSSNLFSLFSPSSDSKVEQKIDTEKIAFEIHHQVNEVRKLYDLKPLSWSSKIADIATKHSKDMSDRDYLDHISPEGNDVADRFKQANFVCDRKLPNGDILKGGENLAEVSYPDDITGIGTRVVQSWMDSPSHRKNLLFEDYATEGIGVIFSDDVLHITQNFC